MDPLPLELQHLICSFLDQEDICDFRLVCRTFSDIGANFIFQELTVHLHANDLHQLRHVAERYPKCVRAIIYRCDTLRDDVSFENLEGHHQDLMRVSYRKRRVGLTSDLSFLYTEYTKALEIHKRMVDSRDDFRCFAEVFAKLLNLRHITITSDSCFFEASSLPVGRNPFDHVSSKFIGEHHPKGCRNIDVVLSALQTAATELDTLRAGHIHWYFIERNLELLQQPPVSLTRLKHLELVFEGGTKAGEESRTCHPTMKSGILRRFLSSLPHLEVLNLDFGWGPMGDTYHASIDDIIAADHTWQRLNSLALRVLEDGRQDFMAVLNRHKDTLKEICLMDIRLNTMSLPELLAQIRCNLKLDYACICGFITGKADTEGNQVWEIRTHDRNKRWHRISNYCCRGSGSPMEGVCPLSKEWKKSSFKSRDRIKYDSIDEWETRFIESPSEI
ncbi:putative F-box domain-containing protein [Seiridium cardinale]